MPLEGIKILELINIQNLIIHAFIIYAGLECIIEENDGCKNNPENLSITKVNEHIPSDFSISTVSPFRSIENKHDVHRGKDYMKNFCEFLREHAMKIINFKKKERSY